MNQWRNDAGVEMKSVEMHSVEMHGVEMSGVELNSVEMHEHQFLYRADKIKGVRVMPRIFCKPFLAIIVFVFLKIFCFYIFCRYFYSRPCYIFFLISNAKGNK